MKRSKAWRRWKDWCIQKKRFKFMKGDEGWWTKKTINRFEKEKHRLSKRHPCDCGKSKCYLCNYEKLMNIKNPKDIKRSKIKDEEYYEWYMNGWLDLEENQY